MRGETNLQTFNRLLGQCGKRFTTSYITIPVNLSGNFNLVMGKTQRLAKCVAWTSIILQKLASCVYLALRSASCLSKCEGKATAVPLCMMTFWYSPLASGDSINKATLMPPVDSPNMVTFVGSPPNLISYKH